MGLQTGDEHAEIEDYDDSPIIGPYVIATLVEALKECITSPNAFCVDIGKNAHIHAIARLDIISDIAKTALKDTDNQ